MNPHYMAAEYAREIREAGGEVPDVIEDAGDRAVHMQIAALQARWVRMGLDKP